MTDAPRPEKSGWMEAAFESIVAWFPDLPRWIKVVFASASIYLALCFVAQVSPVALFQALSGALNSWVMENRTIAAAERAASQQERLDMIALLREQNRDLRAQTSAPPQPPLIEHERRIAALEAQVSALMDSHPAVMRGKAVH